MYEYYRSSAFAFTHPGDAHFEVYDATGAKLRTRPDSGYVIPGQYEVTILPADSVTNSIASGVYFCRSFSADTSFVRKFVILR